MRILRFIFILAFCGFAAGAQSLVYTVDGFDPSGSEGFSYAAGGITNVWSDWFGSAFQSLAWDPTNDANSNPASGSLKIVADFTPSQNQWEVFDGFNGIAPPLNGSQFTNFQCDVRFAPGSATTSNGGMVSFGHLEFGVVTVGYGQDYFGSVDVAVTDTNWVHVSLPINAGTDTNLAQITDVLLHIYGPYYGSGLNGPSTLWVDNIQFVGPPPPTSGVCAVDWNKVYQRIDGFGASSAWRSQWTTAQADMFFSTNSGVGTTLDGRANFAYNGIALSLLRSRIAPGGRSVETNIMLMAQQRGAKVWSTPWSPAAMFKDNDTVNGGSFVGTQSNYLAYARQVAGYVATMKSIGINLYAISVQNEPDAIVTNYESCNWSAQQIHDYTTNLFNALAADNVSATKIMLPESQNWLDYENLAAITMNDTNAVPEVGIIAAHNYDGLYGPSTLGKNSYGKALWETEVAILSGSDSSITNGVYYAQRIHQFLTEGQVNAWHYWWLMSGDANSNEGLADTNGMPAKRMYALGNFSRFLRPNFYRIDVTNSGPLQVSAYQDSASGAFAIVAINSSSVTVTQVFNLTNIAAVAAVTPWVTSSALSLDAQEAVGVTNLSFSYALPSMSVVTFTGSQYAAPPPGFNTIYIDSLGGQSNRFTYVGVPNGQYLLRQTSTLSPANWRTVATLVAGPDGVVLSTNIYSSSAACFFRIEAANK